MNYKESITLVLEKSKEGLEIGMTFTINGRNDILFKLSNKRTVKDKLLEMPEIHYDYIIIKGYVRNGHINEKNAINLIKSGTWKQVNNEENRNSGQTCCKKIVDKQT